MAHFRIIIQGIGLFYMKNGLWKTIFPFGGCHNVRMKTDPLDPKGTALQASNGLIEIKASGAQSSTERDRSLDAFIDLSAAHANGIRLHNDWQDKSTLLTIESAVLSLESYTNCSYAITEHGRMPNAYAPIGYSVKADIVADELSFSFTGIQKPPPDPIREDALIIFDNACHGKVVDKTGDLKMLYDHVIWDKKDPGYRLEVDRDPFQNPPTKSLFKSAIIGYPSDNPIKYEDGLPCNLFQGDPGDLP